MMATATLSQTPLPLNNKFALLEETDQLSDLPSLRSFAARPKNHSRLNSTDTLTSWSVVDSDDEQDHHDDDKDEALYTWSSPNGQDTTELPPPLAVASLDDGFTGISKVLTVQSINGAAAAAVAPQGSWLIKGKKMKKAATAPLTTPTSQEQGHLHKHDDNDHDYDDYDDDDDDVYAFGGDLDSGLEHELSKSARAVNRRNIRVASARDRKLSEVVSTGTRSKMDYKEVREARWLSKAQKSTDNEYATSGTTRK
ncbi:hypothetical protein BGZ73_006661 [Actinomortierella ambigua]|nr:hypothetical protein BGZ73_006661 [Actinomortierella ambigua]